jgi:18S rRNA (guanine1575-N7)-methyltransferase
MSAIQTQLSERALELLNLPEDGPPLFLLDIGCGTALSGQVLEEAGHYWVGMDISRHMLDIAANRELDGDFVQSDMGEGVPFRPGTFDGAISISALQWLCNADTKEQVPQKRLKVFFESLYASLRSGTRAVFQFYPADSTQMEMITVSAMKCGFTSRVVVDFPNSSKAKKFYLCLYCGAQPTTAPKALGVDEAVEGVDFTDRKKDKKRRGKKGNKNPVKSKDWVLAKKDRQKRQGKEVRPDSKYTARSRRRFL